MDVVSASEYEAANLSVILEKVCGEYEALELMGHVDDGACCQHSFLYLHLHIIGSPQSRQRPPISTAG